MLVRLIGGGIKVVSGNLIEHWICKDGTIKCILSNLDEKW